MLHTLMNSPWYSDLDTIIRMVNYDDDFVLFQDGVIGAIKDSIMQKKLLSIPTTIWVLQEDLEARGLSKKISVNFHLLDYTGFVKLTMKHSQQIAW
ncbi:sulfurtransferase complex subunit TusB [Candidatus Ishikawella capsulata]|uniref:Protein TusB n=1 Tax=Candidatus Ishikawaella capsulata Mpkobe TaxID=476281 RepID=C5WCP9_9ENTR|nr:sulfurtransferase complex subunit TusB [Candidatus Ishikawaella capsulata]BAH83105.1 predicted intracellular sulfur oxidation protein tusB [Candidatus Ishikawaella capsulata Mpkobe]